MLDLNTNSGFFWAVLLISAEVIILGGMYYCLDKWVK